MKLVLAVLAVGDVPDELSGWPALSNQKIYVGLLVFVVLFSWFIFHTWKRHACPKCKRWVALETTEEVKEGTWTGRYLGSSYTPGDEEVKCKYCGDRHWRRPSSNAPDRRWRTSRND
jgi:hypothetical protein